MNPSAPVSREQTGFFLNSSVPSAVRSGLSLIRGGKIYTPMQDEVIIKSTPTRIVARDSFRDLLSISNESGSTVFVAYGSSGANVTCNTGLPLKHEDALVFEGEEAEAEVWAITSLESGERTLTYQTLNKQEAP